MNKITTILNYLEELYPNAHCELNYNKDYELLIAIVLSAQTTDKGVNKVTKVLFKTYPTLKELSDAPIENIEKIIKQIGTYKKKSMFVKEIANHILTEQNGNIPNDRKYLETLPGVGNKTINVFLSEYYKIPQLAVDTHVERVSKRLNLSKENDTVKEVEENLKKIIPKSKWIKAHHSFIFFGRYHCKAINPNCQNCKLHSLCKYYKQKKDNIIYITKSKESYYLTYKNLKSICLIGKKGATKNKKEGDLKTPIGIFELGITFGTHNKQELKIDKKIKYIKINKNLYWIDDSNSKYYNQLIDKTKVKKDWQSAEYLHEYQIPYEYAIEIKANKNNIKGKGSAIFIHCMNENNKTAGCIALPKNKMKELLEMIDKDTKINILSIKSK